jgi:hypothetical protein
MKRITKIFLFWFLVLSFCTAAPLAILYSEGFRIDFKSRKIFQTGGLFLKILPSGAEVYLNGKLAKKTNFVFNSVFLGNLLPKQYEITIKKDGYFDWHKTLAIRERQVTEAKNIILFPQKITLENLSKNLENAFLLPDKKGALLIKKTEKEGLKIDYLDLINQKEIPLLEEKEVLSKKKKKQSLKFLNLFSSSDSKKILLALEVSKEKKYFLIDLLEPKPIEIKIPQKAKDIGFLSQNSDKIAFLAPFSDKKSNLDSALLILKDQKNPSLLLANDKNIVDFAFFNGEIMWLTDEGFLYLGRIVEDKIEPQKTLNLTPISISQEKNYKIFVKDQKRVFVKEDDLLYYLDPKTQVFEKIFERAKKIKFSDDLKKVAIANDYQIWLFYLEKEYQQPQREAKELFLLDAFEEKIKDIFWLDSSHLIVAFKDKIRVLEIDNRSNLNIYTLINQPIEKVFWDQTKKALFVYNQEGLFLSETIIK